MTIFAKIENGVVVNLTLVSIENCAGGILPASDIVGGEYLAQLGIEGEWITSDSVDGQQRFNRANIGDLYDNVRDAFMHPQFYPSWTLNEYNCQWEAPSIRPSEGIFWSWDEDTLSWVEQIPPDAPA